MTTAGAHARTPQTPARQDSILLEAQNHLALNRVTSVLDVSSVKNLFIKIVH